MMPIVKMQNRKIACARPKGIQWYIEDKVPGRCLAKEFLNMMAWRTAEWAKDFDRRRMIEGNDRPYHGKPAVQYVHAEISPDPRDAVTVEEMVSFAREWAAHWFGDDFKPGKLGCFQVAIGIHDDNENGIMHAHVVVNNTDLLTGKRLHFNRDDNRAVQDQAQDLARDRGWYYFDYTKDHHWIKVEADREPSERRAMLQVGKASTIAERRMADRGVDVWKDRLRDRIFSAKSISRNERQFISACEEMGIGVQENADSDLVYSIDWEGGKKKAAGANLGRGWKGKGVEGRRTLAKQMPREDARALRANVLKVFSEMRTWEVKASGVAEHEIAQALLTMHRWHVWTHDGLDRAARKCAKRLHATEGKEKEAVKEDYRKLIEAKKTVAKADLVRGIDPASDKQTMVRQTAGSMSEAMGGVDGSRTVERARSASRGTRI